MENSSPTEIDRRQFLATTTAVATTGVAGCTSFQSRNGVGDSGATDVIVESAASEPRTVTITITEIGSDTPHTSRTLDLSPGETVDPVNSTKLPTNDSYTVEVTIENGPSETFEWENPSVELSPLWVRIDESQNIKFLLQAG